MIDRDAVAFGVFDALLYLAGPRPSASLGEDQLRESFFFDSTSTKSCVSQLPQLPAICYYVPYRPSLAGPFALRGRFGCLFQRVDYSDRPQFQGVG